MSTFQPMTRRTALRMLAVACAAVPTLVATGCTKEDEPPMKYASVSLPANAGTGYSWTCAVEPAGVLKLTGEEVVSEDAQVNGGPTSYVFTFEAQAEGRVTATFTNARPWEEDVEPEGCVTVVLAVDAELNVSEVSQESTGTKSYEASVVIWN